MKNVIVLMQSRTGSSMVAAVFRAHGWLTGGANMFQPAMPPRQEYISYENQAIKRHLVGTYGKARAPLPPILDRDTELAAVVDGEFGGRPWCWKGNAYYAPVFLSTFPNLHRVFVYREIAMATRSALASRSFPMWKDGAKITRHEAREELERTLCAKYEYMDEMWRNFGGTWVDTGKVRGGSLRSIRWAIKAAGGEWDEDAARSVIRELA